MTHNTCATCKHSKRRIRGWRIVQFCTLYRKERNEPCVDYVRMCYNATASTKNPSASKAHRLEIARKLKRWSATDDVMERIKAMPYPEREHLRSLVDWVEDYERGEYIGTGIRVIREKR